MKKWEYKIVNLYPSAGSFLGIDEQEINNLGHEGWDLVGLYKNDLIFKREKVVEKHKPTSVNKAAAYD